MIQAMSSHPFEAMERPLRQMQAGRADFAELFGGATPDATKRVNRPDPPGESSSAAASTTPAQSSAGDPDVQDWLNSYYAEMGNAGAANISYQPAQGAPNNYPDGSVYGPDAIYTQAVDNQIGNSFSALTGEGAAEYTSQLPGVPSEQAQQTFDHNLAMENAQRLSWGQAIDTTAYWSDPGSINYEGVTYTSQELGYAGPCQSAGPQPIYISVANQIQGTDTFTVPGYSGTVKGIQAGKYYTLQQLEAAGLPSGQPDAQFHPGSWTTAPST